MSRKFDAGKLKHKVWIKDDQGRLLTEPDRFFWASLRILGSEAAYYNQGLFQTTTAEVVMRAVQVGQERDREINPGMHLAFDDPTETGLKILQVIPNDDHSWLTLIIQW